jgi:hypothetical protein
MIRSDKPDVVVQRVDLKGGVTAGWFSAGRKCGLRERPATGR